MDKNERSVTVIPSEFWKLLAIILRALADWLDSRNIPF
jgi:hypothetical protein